MAAKIKLTGKGASHEGVNYKADKDGHVIVPDEAAEVFVRLHGATLIEEIPDKEPKPPKKAHPASHHR